MRPTRSVPDRMMDRLRDRTRSGLCLSLLGFRDDLARIEPQRKGAKADLYRGPCIGMILLTFASGSNCRFRIVLSVTILQQLTHARSTEATFGSSRFDGTCRKSGENQLAANLPKSWARAGAFWLLTPNSKLAHN